MRHGWNNPTPRPTGADRRRGAILLEVVMAMTLFTIAAGVIGAGISRAFDAAERMRIRSRAADLAVTLSSEVSIGIVPMARVPMTAYDDELLADWEYSVEVETLDPPPGVTLSAEAQADAAMGETEPLANMSCVTITVHHMLSDTWYTLVEFKPGVELDESEIDADAGGL